MKKVARSGLNYFVILILIALGVLGLALPIAPGLIFIVIAVVILSYEIPSLKESFNNKFKRVRTLEKFFKNIKLS